MTKLRNVKLATKFVFREEPGVWKKMTTNKAKCVFGPRDQVGKEVEIDPDAQVFVIENDPRRTPRAETDGNEVMKVVFQEDEDQVICERIVPIGEAIVLSRAEIVCIRTAPRKHKELLSIGDVGFDMEARALHLEVMTRETMKRKEKEDDGHKGTARTSARDV